MTQTLKYRNHFLFFLPALLCLFLLPHNGISQDINKLLSMARKQMENVSDYTAEGTMKTNVSFLKVPVSKVKVYYKKPDKVKIKSEKGVSFVPRGAVSLNVSSLLDGNDFDVVDGGVVRLGGKELSVARLLPKSDDNPVIISTLYLDPANGLVQRAKTTTKENGTYELEFTYGKFASQGLPDKILFSFDARDYKLPKGITFDFDDGSGNKSNAAKLKKEKGTALLVLNKYLVNTGLSDAVFK